MTGKFRVHALRETRVLQKCGATLTGACRRDTGEGHDDSGRQYAPCLAQRTPDLRGRQARPNCRRRGVVDRATHVEQAID